MDARHESMAPLFAAAQEWGSGSMGGVGENPPGEPSLTPILCDLAFFRDKRYGHAIVLYREDTGVAVLATWKKGIDNIPGESPMLPGAITWKPRMDVDEMKRLKEVVKNAGGQPTPHQVDLMRYQQWVHVNDILDRPLGESYQARVIEHFNWAEWVDAEKRIVKPHVRSDTRLKNYPYRERPISPPN